MSLIQIYDFTRVRAFFCEHPTFLDERQIEIDDPEKDPSVLAERVSFKEKRVFHFIFCRIRRKSVLVEGEHFEKFEILENWSPHHYLGQCHTAKEAQDQFGDHWKNYMSDLFDKYDESVHGILERYDGRWILIPKLATVYSVRELELSMPE